MGGNRDAIAEAFENHSFHRTRLARTWRALIENNQKLEILLGQLQAKEMSNTKYWWDKCQNILYHIQNHLNTLNQHLTECSKAETALFNLLNFTANTHDSKPPKKRKFCNIE
jgi:hypothetical protein